MCIFIEHNRSLLNYGGKKQNYAMQECQKEGREKYTEEILEMKLLYIYVLYNMFLYVNVLLEHYK